MSYALLDINKDLARTLNQKPRRAESSGSRDRLFSS